MTVRVFRSTDTSAPTLNGTSGSLITLLDAVLVNGYGTQTAAWWTKPFSGTNLASYQQGTGSNNFYLKVRDDLAEARESNIRGFETMTQVTATDSAADGTGPFPTVAQIALGIFVRKSSVADSSPRAWMIIADARTFYLFILSADVAATYFSTMFGEIYSFKTSDSYRAAIAGRAATGGAGTSENFGNMGFLSNSFTVMTGHYIVRDASGTAGAIGGLSMGNTGCNGGALSTTGGLSSSLNSLGMKNVTDHKVYLFPLRAGHTQGGNTVRGRFRGIWHVGHSQSTLSDGDTFTGSGSLTGKTFMVVKQVGTSSTPGAFCVEISNTWDTN